MSNSRVCKFYIRGNCRYGSSCRFLHSDYQEQRSKKQYYDEYQPRNNRNVRQQYNATLYDTNDDSGSYDQYEQRNYQSVNKTNNHKKRNYDSQKNYSPRNDYDYYEDDSSKLYKDAFENRNNHKSPYEHTAQNYYSINDNNRGRDIVSNKRNYKNINEFDHQSKNENNREYFNNDYKDNSHSNRNIIRYKDSEIRLDHTDHYERIHSIVKEKLLIQYVKEIQAYQMQVKGMLNSNMWPLTCYQPVGHHYPIQPVGSLNLIEVSFEEIRCDYYLSKNISADPGLIHKRIFNELILKAQEQKNNILSFVDHVQDDLLATFAKCEQSKNDPMFQNNITVDQNSYWNMSINSVKMPDVNRAQLDSFSFVIDKEKTNTNSNTANTTALKILMQTEIYGKMDCDAYAQEHFTDFIPVMPPPKKYC